jgi:transposase-like protein
MSSKYTITEFNFEYPTEEACINKIYKNRYGKLEHCPKCEKPFKYYKVNERKCYACQFCSNQIHPLAGTIFHKSETDLKLWFYAIFLFACSKNGVSAKELERQLGVTYKTAWRMAKQIRSLFEDDSNPLQGTVEIDETYMGGKEQNKHESKRKGALGTQGKTAVIGAVERKGNIRARVVDDTTRNEVTPFVRGKISINSEVFTDEYNVYDNLHQLGYNHKQINHSAKEYVNGNVHTNTIEGFWSQLKRSIEGTYHMVSPKYLQSYVNEFAWRYNRRNQTKLFNLLISNI